MGGSGVVVVGASQAGFRAAEALREGGYGGPITMVGDEPHRPYDRPPLSKQVLAGTQAPEDVVLTPAEGGVDDLDLRWRLGTTATGLDLGARELPIRPDVVGASLSLAANERVKLSGPTPLTLELQTLAN